MAVAEAWGQEQWADYSGVSRTMQALTVAEAQRFIQCLQPTSSAGPVLGLTNIAPVLLKQLYSKRVQAPSAWCR